jgi:IclR family pca regulon transcriptional regulator
MRHVTDQAPARPDRPARSYRVEALAKGLRLLSYFTAERPALHVKDLVALSGIPMPTVFRLVATLTEEGYLERTVDGMVRPGTGVLVLGFAAMQGLDLVQMSEPVLRDLAAETGETVNLGVLYGDQVLFVARIPRRDTLVAANLRVGGRIPACRRPLQHPRLGLNQPPLASPGSV